MMHYTTELLDDNTLLFRFTVPAEEYTAALDDAWRTHKARYPVPGMRDGKASRTMIERHHGKDVFEKPALDQLVTSAYRKAASEYPEEIYYTPTVRVEQHEEGKALCFTARVQIRPEVRLGDYRAVQLQPEDLRRAAQKAQEVPGEQQSETRAYLLRSALVDRIAADPAFGLTKEEIAAGLVPENFVGRAPQQVEEFIAHILKPIFDANPDAVEQHANLSV